jgi:hypothetical protein
MATRSHKIVRMNAPMAVMAASPSNTTATGRNSIRKTGRSIGGDEPEDADFVLAGTHPRRDRYTWRGSGQQANQRGGDRGDAHNHQERCP